MDFSDILEKHVKKAVESYDGSYNIENPFADILSMGELVDRLSIINFKLYTLKDKVMESSDTDFRAWASVEDVKLVMERARLKKAIDLKLVCMLNTILEGDSLAGVNSEVKRYGHENRS
jgi:hypothetical protein|tara:strand:- start:4332 stop:4688 length:357 start_codon:yes stop_codon:yes gene_type:complete